MCDTHRTLGRQNGIVSPFSLEPDLRKKKPNASGGPAPLPPALAAGGLSRQDRLEPQQRPHLARGPQRRSAPLPHGEMKIIIIPKTFRFWPQSTFPGMYSERMP